MTKLSYRDLLRWASHPSEEELLSYLDQLRARKAGCIRGSGRLLALSGEAGGIERSISGIVKNLNGLLGDSAGYPPKPSLDSKTDSGDSRFRPNLFHRFSISSPRCPEVASQFN